MNPRSQHLLKHDLCLIMLWVQRSHEFLSCLQDCEIVVHLVLCLVPPHDYMKSWSLLQRKLSSCRQRHSGFKPQFNTATHISWQSLHPVDLCRPVLVTLGDINKFLLRWVNRSAVKAVVYLRKYGAIFVSYDANLFRKSTVKYKLSHTLTWNCLETYFG